MELLLINYKNMEKAILKASAEKTRFKNLIIQLEADIELAESFPNTKTTQE